MKSILQDHDKAAIMIVEPASTVRQMISEGFKSRGYKNIHGSATLKDGLAYMEIEKVHWIISPLFSDQSPNALQMLRLIIETPILQRIKFSLFIDPDSEMHCLPLAFELGLFSYHKRCFARDELTPQLDTLFERLEQAKWHHTLLSANYLRDFYDTGVDLKSRYPFEINMMKLFPGDTHTLFCLAKAQFLEKKPEQAITTLRQTQLLAPDKTKEIKALKEKYLGQDHESINEAPETQNILGVELAVVIDSDSDVIFKVKEMLTSVGIQNIKSFENGSKAFEWLASKESLPDLILMEWKIPGISGPTLVQKIRNIGLIQCPVVIISSLIQKDDTAILKEMDVDDCVPKPIQQNDFYATVIWAIQQQRFPSESKAIMQKIKRALALKMIDESAGMISKFMNDEATTASAKLEIEAEYQLAKENWESARDVGLLALKQGGDSLSMLNLVGKAMLKNQQFEDALKCFDRANSISSLNINRMLDVAEASLHAENHEKAEKAIENAEKIDKNDERVTIAKVKLKLEKGQTKAANKLMSSIASGRDIVSYMNGRAVSLAKSHRSDDAAELYTRTISALPEDWPDLVTSVAYNLALSYAREAKLTEAKDILAQIKHFKDQNIKYKVFSLRKRIKECITNKTKLEFKEVAIEKLAEAVSDSEEEQSKNITSAVSPGTREIGLATNLERGDLCCHLLYYPLCEIDKRVNKMIAEAATFRSRRSIDKT